MSDEKTLKLLKYLYPTEEIRGYVCDYLYLELIKIIPKSICITSTNLSMSTRIQNLNKVREIVGEFIEKNSEVSETLTRLFKNKNIKTVIEELIIGYVYYTSRTMSNYKHIDIFTDRRSICYSPISIIDIF